MCVPTLVAVTTLNPLCLWHPPHPPSAVCSKSMRGVLDCIYIISLDVLQTRKCFNHPCCSWQHKLFEDKDIAISRVKFTQNDNRLHDCVKQKGGGCSKVIFTMCKGIDPTMWKNSVKYQCLMFPVKVSVSNRPSTPLVVKKRQQNLWQLQKSEAWHCCQKSSHKAKLFLLPTLQSRHHYNISTRKHRVYLPQGFQ